MYLIQGKLAPDYEGVQFGVSVKLGEEIFEKFRLVSYVTAIIIGIIIGPGVLGLINILPNISLFIALGIQWIW